MAAFAPINEKLGVTTDYVLANPEESQKVVQACMGVVLGPMNKAGVNMANLLALQRCTKMPSCLS